MSDAISITIEEQVVEVTVLTPTFVQINLLQPVILEGISDNTAHRLGDGSDHSLVVLNSNHRLSDGKDHSDVVLNTTHRGRSDNPHQVVSSQVAEDVFDNGIKGIDTIIDWANGAVQSIQYSAIINLSFTGWEALAPLADGKAQSGTLIGIDGDLFAPTFDAVNQGPLPTYVAGFANVQDIASLGPDGVIYNMVQWSNDQHVLLGPENVVNGDFALWVGDNPIGWTIPIENVNNYVSEDANGANIVSDNVTPFYINQTGIMTAGDYYAELDVFSIVGTLTFATAGGSFIVLQDFTTPGVKKVFFTLVAGTGFNIGAKTSNALDCVVRLVSIKRLF